MSTWAEDQPAFEAALAAALPAIGTEPRALHEAMRYAVLGSGKRLRPRLCLAAAAAAGGDRRSAFPAGVAVEFLHSYSLVHDDLPCLDNDDLRRGRPTVHKVFGEATALLAGDALQTAAFAVLAPLPGAAGLVAELAAAAGHLGMVGGQAAELETGVDGLDLAGLESIHRRKTGALFRAAVRLGALTAAATPAVLSELTAFADDFGLAYQVVDDLLDSDADDGTPNFARLLGVVACRQRATELLAGAVERARRLHSLDLETMCGWLAGQLDS